MAFIGKDSVTVTSLDSAESMSVVTDLTVDTNTFKVDSTANRVGILNATPDVTLDVGSATDAIHIPVGTTAQRPGTPSSGYFRFNTSLNQFEGYTNTWGAIGGGGTNTFTHDSFTGDNSTTDFILSQSTESENNLFVFIDGVFQTQDAYSIATAAGQTTLTLSAPPATGRKIIVYTVAAGVSGNNLNQNRFDALTSDAVDGLNTVFTLSIPPVNKNNTQVFFDGVYQHKENYSISGTTLTFTDAPPLGVVIEVMIFTQTEVNVPVDDSITSAKLSGDLTTPGNLTVTGYLAGPATFIIDPAAVGDDTGTVQIKGNLQVDGTQTTINSTTLEVDDLNITLASGAVDALSADGAGITIDGASATLTYVNAGDNWNFNKNLDVTGTVTADGLTVDHSVDTAATFTRTSANTYRIEHDLNQFYFWNATTSEAPLIFQNDGDVIMNAGNVGIGTSSPLSRLTVQADASANGINIVGRSGGQEEGWLFWYKNDASTLNAGILGDNQGLKFTTGSANTERLRIDSSGNVGIGTAPQEKLYLYSGNTYNLDPALYTSIGSNDTAVNSNAPYRWRTGITGDATGYDYTFSTLARSESVHVERMRIDASGNLLVGVTSKLTESTSGIDVGGTAASEVFLAKNTAALTDGYQAGHFSYYGSSLANLAAYKHSGITTAAGYLGLTDGGGNNYFFYHNGGTFRVSASATDTGTTSGTVVGTQTSDERLKNIDSESFNYGINTVKQLVPIKYTYKDDEATVVKLGFGAQTTQTIVPEAVYDTKQCLDGYDSDPNDSMNQIPKSDETILAMEYVQLIPVLTKAIQEQQDLIESLTARIAALEGAN